MMRKSIRSIIIAILVILIGFFAFRHLFGNKPTENREPRTENRVEYYTCGMHPSVKISPEAYDKGSVNCPICNMKLVPVYSAEGGSAYDGKEAKTNGASREKKILFYRNPMNPNITSKESAKDEMGMEYIPVYEEAEEGGEYYGCGMEGEEHQFLMKDVEAMDCPICGMPLKKLSKEEADKLKGVVSRVKLGEKLAASTGVRTGLVRKLRLYKVIRTVGSVAYDPELAITQEEFISSLRALDEMKEGNIPEIKERALKLVESSKRKLRLLGLSIEQIEKLESKREVQTNLILPEEKMWIYGDVYEYELSWVKKDAKVKVTTSSLPGEEFNGIISSLNPVLDRKTRTVRFRAEVDNPGLRLIPEMYVDVAITSMYKGPEDEDMVLAIPKEAILDTGVRRIVWIDKGNGEYEGRRVEIGPEATSSISGEEAKFYPVLKGLKEGDLVVTKANFLVDSQSQLTGAAAVAYGGAIGVDEDKEPKGSHSH
ncbi:MAG: efflux RND transporter periplasmic adaptor subunit [Candidatus Omnitrophota bacterium]